MTSDETSCALSPEQHALNRAAYTHMRDDPELAEVDWRLESGKSGNLMVSPAPTRRHRHRQSRILALITRLLRTGTALVEFSVSTPDGVKGPDVDWLSPEHSEKSEDDLDDLAPEICIEVMSSSQSARLISSKVAAYFASGAREVWVRDPFGTIAFYAEGRGVERSRLCPEFPDEIFPS